MQSDQSFVVQMRPSVGLLLFIEQTVKALQRLDRCLGESGPEVIKPFSCSTQLRMKFFLLIKN